jgi:hypothetical protein
LGLAARPLNIYTSGGVEKVPETKEKKADTTAVKVIKTRRSEGVIKRNEDGTTSIVYPDSDDDDDGVRAPTEMGEETPVIKGYFYLEELSDDCRTTGDCCSTKYTEYSTYIHTRRSMARETSRQIWRQLR